MSDAVQRFFGGALMAVGGLIAGLCGTCTLAVLGAGVISQLEYPSSTGAILGPLVLYLAIGGLPTWIGVLIFRAGLRRFRPQRRVSKAAVAVFNDDEPPP